MAAAIVELALVVLRVPRSALGTTALALAWLVSTLVLWRPWHAVTGAESPSWSSFAVVLAVQGASQAVLQVQWSAVFPVLFVTDADRAWASWCKQTGATAALLISMAGVPALSGPGWETSEYGGMVVVTSAAVFSGLAAVLLGPGGGLVDALGSTEPAAGLPSPPGKHSTKGRKAWARDIVPRCTERIAAVWARLASSRSLRAFLVSDALAVVGNSTLTALFPLFCRLGAGMGAGPVSVSVLPRAVAVGLPPWVAAWTSGTLQPSAQIPAVYAVFYTAGTLCAPLWAWAAARFDLVRLWQAETTGYLVGLALVLVVDSFEGVLLLCAVTGACVSGFTMLPELLIARLVDESAAIDPGTAAGAHAQSVVATKALCRRAASAVQGLLTAAVLTWTAYVPAVPAHAQGASVAPAIRAATFVIPAVFFASAALVLDSYELRGPLLKHAGAGSCRSGPPEGLTAGPAARHESPWPENKDDDADRPRRRGGSAEKDSITAEPRAASRGRVSVR